jgi:hypothetical protein
VKDVNGVGIGVGGVVDGRITTEVIAEVPTRRLADAVLAALSQFSSPLTKSSNEPPRTAPLNLPQRSHAAVSFAAARASEKRPSDSDFSKKLQSVHCHKIYLIVSKELFTDH